VAPFDKIELVIFFSTLANESANVEQYIFCTQTTNMLIANQTLADLAVSVFILASTRPGTNMNHDSAWDQLVCRFWGSAYFFYVALIASTYNILVLTAERYLAVIYPVLHKVCRTVCELIRG
jgi:hypothetical protein